MTIRGNTSGTSIGSIVVADYMVAATWSKAFAGRVREVSLRGGAVKGRVVGGGWCRGFSSLCVGGGD